MEISIIDKSPSKINDEANVRLLWTACLIGESISCSAMPSDMLDFYLLYDMLSEHQKFTMYMTMHKGNPSSTVNTSEEMEDFYAHIIRSRNMKGKTKEHIVLLMKAEKDLKNMLDDFKAWLKNIIDNMKISALFPLVCNDPDTHEKPLLVWHFPNEDNIKHKREIIVLFAGGLPDCEWLLLFDGMIKQYATAIDMNHISSDFQGNVFLSDFLLEIPEPLTLTSAQIHLIRNEFSKTSWPFFSELEKINDKLKDIPFEQNNFHTIASLYNEKISGLKLPFQKDAEQNQLFNQLKNNNGNKKRYRIFLGISSFNIILGFYRELGIIDSGTELYVKEKIGDKVDMNNSHLFLYLEVAEEK